MVTKWSTIHDVWVVKKIPDTPQRGSKMMSKLLYRRHRVRDAGSVVAIASGGARRAARAVSARFTGRGHDPADRERLGHPHRALTELGKRHELGVARQPGHKRGGLGRRRRALHRGEAVKQRPGLEHRDRCRCQQRGAGVLGAGHPAAVGATAEPRRREELDRIPPGSPGERIRHVICTRQFEGAKVVEGGRACVRAEVRPTVEPLALPCPPASDMSSPPRAHFSRSFSSPAAVIAPISMQHHHHHAVPHAGTSRSGRDRPCGRGLTDVDDWMPAGRERDQPGLQRAAGQQRAAREHRDVAAVARRRQRRHHRRPVQRRVGPPPPPDLDVDRNGVPVLLWDGDLDPVVPWG